MSDAVVALVAGEVMLQTIAFDAVISNTAYWTGHDSGIIDT
jgi:hypothetical protein